MRLALCRACAGPCTAALADAQCRTRPAPGTPLEKGLQQTPARCIWCIGAPPVLRRRPHTARTEGGEGQENQRQLAVSARPAVLRGLPGLQPASLRTRAPTDCGARSFARAAGPLLNGRQRNRGDAGAGIFFSNVLEGPRGPSQAGMPRYNGVVHGDYYIKLQAQPACGRGLVLIRSSGARPRHRNNTTAAHGRGSTSNI